MTKIELEDFVQTLIYQGIFEGVAGNLDNVDDSYGSFGDRASFALDNWSECIADQDLNFGDKEKRG